MRNIKFETFGILYHKLADLGLSHILIDIIEITKTGLLSSPRTIKKAEAVILNWWNNNKIKPKITEHELSYFCLYELRKEFNKRR